MRHSSTPFPRICEWEDCRLKRWLVGAAGLILDTRPAPSAGSCPKVKSSRFQGVVRLSKTGRRRHDVYLRIEVRSNSFGAFSSDFSAVTNAPYKEFIFSLPTNASRKHRFRATLAIPLLFLTNVITKREKAPVTPYQEFNLD